MKMDKPIDFGKYIIYQDKIKPQTSAVVQREKNAKNHDQKMPRLDRDSLFKKTITLNEAHKFIDKWLSELTDYDGSMDTDILVYDMLDVIAIQNQIIARIVDK